MTGRTRVPEQRVAAYVVCRRDDAVLLTRLIGRQGPRWTLPGGGIDHGEDPADGALRELTEETGYTGRLDELLGIDSLHTDVARESGPVADHHGLRIVYSATIVGGELRHEVGGSTDQAAWFDLLSVPRLDRVSLVDIGLQLHRERPPVGRITPAAMPTGGQPSRQLNRSR